LGQPPLAQWQGGLHDHPRKCKRGQFESGGGHNLNMKVETEFDYKEFSCVASARYVPAECYLSAELDNISLNIVPQVERDSPLYKEIERAAVDFLFDQAESQLSETNTDEWERDECRP